MERMGLMSIPNKIKSRPGSTLVVIIIVLLMMSLLAGAMYTLNSTSFFGQAGSVGARNAFYLAEAGYRFAASEAIRGTNTNNTLLGMNGQTYTLDTGGQFSLVFTPYYFKVTSVLGNTLVAETYYGQATTSIPTGAGQIEVGGTVIPYVSASIVGNQVTFVSSGGWGSAAADDVVLLSAQKADAAAVPEGGDLVLGSTGGLPAFNGIIKIQGATKNYRYARLQGNTLKNIRMEESTDSWEAPPSAVGTHVVLTEFTELRSTGQYGTGTFTAQRDVNYYLPVKLAAGGGGALEEFGDEPYTVTPPSADHWDVDGTTSDVVQARYYDPGGGSSDTFISTDIRIKGYHERSESGETIRFNFVNFKWGPETVGGDNIVDFPGAWAAANKTLSYDVQAKCSYNPDIEYASSGILFRWDGASGYGISFLRVASSTDYIPNGVSPTDAGGTKQTDKLLMVLWKRTYSGGVNTQWLAYKWITKTIPSLNYCIFGFCRYYWPSDFQNGWDEYVRGWQYGPDWGTTYDGFFLHDETTIMARVVEHVVNGVKVNDIQVFFGDTNSTLGVGRSPNAINYDVRTLRAAYPRSDSFFSTDPEEGWLDKWPPLDMTNWSSGAGTPEDSGNDYFTSVDAPVTWDRVAPGVTVVNETEMKPVGTVIRDSTFVSPSGAEFAGAGGDADRPEIAVHTFGNTQDSYSEDRKAFFKDIAIKLYKFVPGAGAGGFGASVQK